MKGGKKGFDTLFMSVNDFFPLFFFFFSQVYKRKNEAAKKEYLKALAEYRGSRFSQVSDARQELQRSRSTKVAAVL